MASGPIGVSSDVYHHQPRACAKASTPGPTSATAPPPARAPTKRRVVARVKYVVATSNDRYTHQAIMRICVIVVHPLRRMARSDDHLSRRRQFTGWNLSLSARARDRKAQGISSIIVGGLPSDREWNLLLGKRFQGGLGHNVFTRTKNPPGESSDQEAKRSFFSLTVREDDYHHFTSQPQTTSAFRRVTCNLDRATLLTSCNPH